MPIIYRGDNLREKVFQKLLSMSSEQEAYFNDNSSLYFRNLEHSSAKIRGTTIKSIYHPYVLSSMEFYWIKRKSEKLWSILEKTGKLMITDKRVADFFNFPDELVGLLKVNPGYDMNIPITRFDAFYNEAGSIYFCEFNTDGTSGMNETNTMEGCYLDTDLGRRLINSYSLQQCELRISLLETLLECYKAFGGTHKPTIAIVDFLDKATIAEFEALKDVFIREGYKTFIADPRDLLYMNDNLWYKGTRIDLVYRRAVTTELLERYQSIQEFIKAYINNAFCMVGSFRSEAAHSKLVFTFLTSSAAEDYFSEDEISFIKEHLPNTVRLESGKQELLELLLKEKDNYIIKPHNSYGSQGLFMGKDCSEEQWNLLINDNMGKNYIAQELIPIPSENFIISPGRSKELKVNLSPFLYGGKLRGFYTRISEIEVITTARGGALIPTFVE